MKVVALTPDLFDRSRIAEAVPGVTFVSTAAQLSAAAEDADVVLVDLQRPGALDVLADVVARAGRVVAFGAHVEGEQLAAAVALGAEAVPRSRLFRDLASFTATKQS